MPASLEFLRGVLGFIGVACAYMLGRAIGLARKGQPQRRIYSWVIRTVICLGAVALRHPIDVEDIAVWSLAVVAFGAAFWDASRARKEEPVKLEIYPDDH
jgi:hypothetical protein